jgi:hypothetical protein
MTAGPDLVSLAREAQRVGEAVAAASMAAAQATPGLGFQVALPTPASGAATGEGYSLPSSTPALRPVAHVGAQPSYGSPLVGGQSFGGSVGFLDGLEGVQMPVPAYRFVPVSSPSRPLLDRIRAALGVLLGRR